MKKIIEVLQGAHLIMSKFQALLGSTPLTDEEHETFYKVENAIKELNDCHLTRTETELVNEVDQLILHAEEDSLTYSVLEHARMLVFKINHPADYAKYNTH